jgi:hypothetical protein
MRRGARSRAGRPGLTAGVVAVLLVTAAAGSLAIVHYASLGTAGDGMGPVRSGAALPAGLPSRGTPTLGRHTQPATSRHGPSSASPRAVRARPTRENKGVNRPFNRTTGQHVGSSFFSGDAPQAGRLLAPRINGNFTGTTS